MFPDRQGRRLAGYTLMEMLLVLVLMSLLLATALPAYRQLQLKSGRKVAAGMLQVVAARQEAFLRNYHHHAATVLELGFPEPLYIDAMAAPAPRSRALYQLELLPVEEGYTGVRAVAINAQVADHGCRELWLAVNGEKRARDQSGEARDDCWQ